MLLSKEINRDKINASGTLGFIESKRMSVDNDSVDIILHALTDLYSDPEKGVLREYLSNAIDTHVESGQTDPILVTRPNFFDTNFVVEDFGTGMSSSTLLNVYSKYGYSTKRQDLSQIGAYGCGAKSALTITDQFTVESVHEGQRTIAIISKDDHGVGVINILSESETDARNGTKITIPVKKVPYFNNKIDEFMLTSKPGLFLVDGIEPPSIYSPSSGYTKYENIFFSPKDLRNHTNISLIIGGINYQFKVTFDMHVLRNILTTGADARFLNRAIIEMPIGSVDFTPSRDDIRNTNHSIENITEAVQQACEKRKDVLTSYINSFDKKIDAIYAYHELMNLNLLPRTDKMTWKNEEVSIVKKISPGDTALMSVQNFFKNNRSSVSYTNEVHFVFRDQGRTCTSVFMTIKSEEKPNIRMMKKMLGDFYYVYFIPEDHPLLKDEEFLSMGIKVRSYTEEYERIKAENRAKRREKSAQSPTKTAKERLATRIYSVYHKDVATEVNLGDFNPDHEYFVINDFNDKVLSSFMPDKYFFRVPNNHKESTVIDFLESIGVKAYSSQQTREITVDFINLSLGKDGLAIINYFTSNFADRNVILLLTEVDKELLGEEISQFALAVKSAYDTYSAYRYGVRQEFVRRMAKTDQNDDTLRDFREKMQEIYSAYPMLKYLDRSSINYHKEDFIASLEDYIKIKKENKS